MSGKPAKPDVISDEDYRRAIRVQDAVLFAQGEERQVLGQLRVRLERGALDAGKLYYFDRARGIVRRRERPERKGPVSAGSRKRKKEETGS